MKFYLAKPSESMFVGCDMFETADDKTIQGFIQNKMGVGIISKGKYIGMPYKNELELMTSYLLNGSNDNTYKNTYKMPSHGWGRVQPENHLSMSLWKRQTRHSICHGVYRDFDMVNCQPNIIRQVAIASGFGGVIPSIIKYCEDPKQCRQDVIDFHKLIDFVEDGKRTITPKDQAKKLFIRLAFGGGYTEWKKDFKVGNDEMGFILDIKSELAIISDQIYKANPCMVADLMVNKEWATKSFPAKKRSVMGLWCQTYERLCQEASVRAFCIKYNVRKNLIVPSQDGFMPRLCDIADDVEVCEIISTLNEALKDEMGFEIQWEQKEFDNPLPNGIPKYVEPIENSLDAYEEPNEITDDDTIVDVVVVDEGKLSFAERKTLFEESNCKILEIDMFATIIGDNTCFKTKAQMLSTYEHLKYTKFCPKLKRKVKVPFIKDWLACETIRRKDRVGVYPHDTKCPANVYNTYFAPPLDNVEFVENKEVVEFMKNHISVLCNHDEYTIDYIMKWLAICVQFPSQKQPMPVFISAEGAGKGSIMSLLKMIFGNNKILQTQGPSEDVWGKFNALMTSAEIVILDEISKKEMMGCEGKIKGLITEPTLLINDKGKSKFSITSIHKFIAFSNPDVYGNEPMTTTQDDRRKVFVQSSNELIGNKTYFDKFYGLLENTDAMATFYNHLKTMEGVKSIIGKKLPTCDYSLELKVMATPILKQFEDYMTTEYKLPSDGVVLSSALYDIFNDWKTYKGVKYECSYLQFGCRFSIQKSNKIQKILSYGADRKKAWRFL